MTEPNIIQATDYTGPGKNKRGMLAREGWVNCGEMLCKDDRYACISYGGLVLWPRLETEAAAERLELQHYRSLWCRANEELEIHKSISAQRQMRCNELELRVIELEQMLYGSKT